jgi:hypothetical protein
VNLHNKISFFINLPKHLLPSPPPKSHNEGQILFGLPGYCSVCVCRHLVIMLNQSGDEPVECPLCMELLEVDDLTFFPCTCGYQVSTVCLCVYINSDGTCLLDLFVLPLKSGVHM